MTKLLILTALLAGLATCQPKKSQAPVPHSEDYNAGYRLYTKNPDSAFYYFNKVVTDSRDSQLVASAYTNMAMLQSDAGDHFGCQESLTQSLRYLAQRDAQSRQLAATNYHELGLAAFNLKNYDESIVFYDRALAFVEDSASRAEIFNNQANAFQKKGEYIPALRLYRNAIAQQVDHQSSSYARMLTNLATTEWLRNPSYPAAPALRKALGIRMKEKDQWGQNSSFAHLSDYYRRSKPDSALYYAGQMRAMAIRLQSTDDELEALDKLIRLSPGSQAKNYFIRYTSLNDSVQAARRAAKNQFALIRYQAQQHKTENLKLQRDNARQENQLLLQRVISGGAVLLLITGGIIGWQWSRKRQQRMRLEKEKAVQEKEYQLLKRVHDVVANGLYRVMTIMEYDSELNTAALLDDIEQLYEKSRDLSYDRLPESPTPLADQISTLLSSFAHAQTKVIIVGNEDNLWTDIEPDAGQEIRLFLLELMINMKKHSQATQVTVRFVRQNSRLSIIYEDNGVGFHSKTAMGNGLTSTGNRIQHLNGQLTFEDGTNSGLKITIAIPLT